MTENKQIKIGIYSLTELEDLLFTGQRDAISTQTFELLIETLDSKTQECEKLKNERTVDLVKQLDQLKAENEILKKDVERWKGNFNSKVSAIEELIKIIQQAIKDFSIEYGTPQYDRLLENTKALGIEVKDYE